MQCSWVIDKLVAFQDDELSPGECTFVGEHLDGCDACSEHEIALRDVTPEPFLEIPPEVLAQMAAAIDQAVADELASPKRPMAPSLWTRSTRWLRKDRDTPNGALLGYGLVLAACLSWGVSNWFAVQALQAEVERPTIAHTTAGDPAGAIVPSDQYQPASWTPEDDSEEWR